MSFIHKKMASGDWAKLTLVEQLANIGSEVSRLASLLKRADMENANYSLDRAIELVDLTIDDFNKRAKETKKSIPAINELWRLREAISDLYCGGKNYGITGDILNDYFINFAIKAQLKNKYARY